MFSRILLFAVFFVVLLVNHEPCAAKRNLLCEHPSSCGSLTNISYPFRLEGDPQNCGDPNYQLTCENNRAILNLYSGKYYVKEINYTDSTIRIADIGLQEDNCSSPPLYHLSRNNFSYGDPYQIAYPFFYRERLQLIFLCCQNPMKSPLYVSTTSCFRGKDSCMSSSSSKKAYRYVVFGDMKAAEVGDSCHVDLVVMATPLDNERNLSYIDIHKNLVYGFSLEWNPIFCRECKGQGFCLLDKTTLVVNCSNPCNFSHVASFHCA